MQHLNYFTLAAMRDALADMLAGGRLQDAFTQQRDELVLVFRTAAGSPRFLQVSCRPAFPYAVLREHFRRARANTLDLFPALQDAPLAGIDLARRDRLLRLRFQDGQALVLKLHGQRANVLHLDEAAAAVDLFQSRQEDDYAFSWPADAIDPLPRWLASPAAFATDLAATGAPDERTALRRLEPRLDKYLLQQLEAHLAADPEAGLHAALVATHAAATDGRFYLWRADGNAGLLLVPLAGYAPLEEHTDVLEAVRAYVSRRLFLERHDALRKRLRQALERRRKRAQDRLNAAEEGLRRLKQQRPPEELGHLLLANLHAVRPGAESVDVPDFYHGNAPVHIPLTPDQSPQANAEAYYAKQKALKQKLPHLEAQREAAAGELAAAADLLAEFDALQGLKDLEQFAKRHPELGGRGSSGDAGEGLPFRRYPFRGHDVLVGKNARNNDRLTFGHARKEDLWLHAKDTAGSHVVVRRPGKTATIPADVLEYAAGLAAWFSKERRNALVPVMYTRRKYLRKPKRLPPGQVLADREEVILIEPLPPPK